MISQEENMATTKGEGVNFGTWFFNSATFNSNGYTKK
jgi:hypothetical protein